jgi:tRNA1(Val) A37 N6-methylase TrmN6
MILPIARLPHLIEELRPGFGDVTVKPLAARAGRDPHRMLIKARKGAKGPFRLCAALILHDGEQHVLDGDDFSDQATRILRDGAALNWDTA